LILTQYFASPNLTANRARALFALKMMERFSNTMSEGEQEELTKCFAPLLVTERQPAHALEVREHVLHDDSLRVGLARGLGFAPEDSVFHFSIGASLSIGP